MNGLFDYAEEAVRLGRSELALAEYGDLFDACLGGIEPLMRRAELLRSLDRDAEARVDLYRAAELAPTSGWPLLRLAQGSHAANRPWLAAAEIAEAVRREPGVYEFRLNAAAMFGTLDWLDRAFAVVRDLPADMTDWWGEVRRHAEDAYRRHRAEVRAMLAARRGLPPGAFDRCALALALFKLGRLAPARRLCEALMREEPGAFSAFEILGWITAREGGAREALCYLRAIRFLHGGTHGYDHALATMARQVEPDGDPLSPGALPPLP